MKATHGKKILWLHDRASLTGGAEHYIQQTAEGLRKRGWRSALLYDPGQASPELLAAFDLSWPAVEPLERLREWQPDLVYLHRQPRNLSLQALAEEAVPVVRFYHDHQLFCLREHKIKPFSKTACPARTGLNCLLCPGMIGRNREGQLAYRSLGQLEADQAACRRFEAAVVASDYMAEQLMLHDFDPARITRLPLTLPEDHRQVTPVPQTPTLLYVGQLLTGKGLDLLLQALAEVLPHHPGLQLQVVGEGRQRARFEAQSRRLGLHEAVHFVGQVAPAQLARFYQAAAWVIVPSRVPETFGMVGLEAMRQGRPVLAADVGGVRTWLSHGQTGYLFPAGDASALASQLLEALARPQITAQMGQQAYARWQQAFQPAQHLQGLQTLFEGLTASQHISTQTREVLV